MSGSRTSLLARLLALAAAGLAVGGCIGGSRSRRFAGSCSDVGAGRVVAGGVAVVIIAACGDEHRERGEYA